jgi:hypothetical protein
MDITPVTLEGTHVRLEPVRLDHVAALWRIGADEAIWRYMPRVMRSEEDMRTYIETELRQQQTLLVKSRPSISRAMRGHFTRGISSVSLAFKRCMQDPFSRAFELTNRVNNRPGSCSALSPSPRLSNSLSAQRAISTSTGSTAAWKSGAPGSRHPGSARPSTPKPSICNCRTRSRPWYPPQK